MAGISVIIRTVTIDYEQYPARRYRRSPKVLAFVPHGRRIVGHTASSDMLGAETRQPGFQSLIKKFGDDA